MTAIPRLFPRHFPPRKAHKAAPALIPRFPRHHAHVRARTGRTACACSHARYMSRGIRGISGIQAFNANLAWKVAWNPVETLRLADLGEAAGRTNSQIGEWGQFDEDSE